MNVLLRSFCADSSSLRISAILVGHLSGKHCTLRKVPQNFHKNRAVKCQNPGSRNSLIPGMPLVRGSLSTPPLAVTPVIPWSCMDLRFERDCKHDGGCLNVNVCKLCCLLCVCIYIYIYIYIYMYTHKTTFNISCMDLRFERSSPSTLSRRLSTAACAGRRL